MAWVDYRKSYNSVPHAWIIQCLELYRCSPALVQFLKFLMNQWKLSVSEWFRIGNSFNQERNFSRWFLVTIVVCFGTFPLSVILRWTNKGYQLSNGLKVSHLLYLDDLKLCFTRQWIAAWNCEVVCSDIGMTFGMEKCTRLSNKHGKFAVCDGLIPSTEITTHSTMDMEAQPICI